MAGGLGGRARGRDDARGTRPTAAPVVTADRILAEGATASQGTKGRQEGGRDGGGAALPAAVEDGKFHSGNSGSRAFNNSLKLLTLNRIHRIHIVCVRDGPNPEILDP